MIRTAISATASPMQMVLQRALCRRADGLAVLCSHVGEQLRQRLSPRPPLIRFEHPPFAFDLPAQSSGRAPGPPRLLCFGRLLPYKGLDLLAGALASLPPQIQISVRVVGLGPETPALDALRACRGVMVENRWVPEPEIGSLLAWSDALILPYREASQSGVAAAAIAAGRPVIATPCRRPAGTVGKRGPVRAVRARSGQPGPRHPPVAGDPGASPGAGRCSGGLAAGGGGAFAGDRSRVAATTKGHQSSYFQPDRRSRQVACDRGR